MQEFQVVAKLADNKIASGTVSSEDAMSAVESFKKGLQDQAKKDNTPVARPIDVRAKPRETKISIRAPRQRAVKAVAAAAPAPIKVGK